MEKTLTENKNISGRKEKKLIVDSTQDKFLTDNDNIADKTARANLVR
jgi:hypothetical protein